MRVPRATYRLQLGPGLTFDAAAALVDYLDALGVSDAYTSPFLDALTASLGGEHADVVALKSLITWFATLPPHAEKGPEGVAARRRDKEVGREKLVALLEASPAVRAFVGENIRLFNGKPGDAQSMDLLDALLTEQAYRAACWRVAGEEINYRRFFDINELAAIRMEEPEVFEATHRLLFRLVREGAVTGLRIDHPDGLYDPADYFRRLHEGAGGEIYVVAEKILAPGEQLPDSWATAGTTGYEFPNLLNGIFVDRAQAGAGGRRRRPDGKYRSHHRPRPRVRPPGRRPCPAPGGVRRRSISAPSRASARTAPPSPWCRASSRAAASRRRRSAASTGRTRPSWCRSTSGCASSTRSPASRSRRATTPCRSATCSPTSRWLCSARTLDDPHRGPALRLHRLRGAAPGARPSRH